MEREKVVDLCMYGVIKIRLRFNSVVYYKINELLFYLCSVADLMFLKQLY